MGCPIIGNKCPLNPVDVWCVHLVRDYKGYYRGTVATESCVCDQKRDVLLSSPQSQWGWERPKKDDGICE